MASDFEREWFKKLPDFMKHKELAHLPIDAQIQFAGLENRLSPENLCCDGEIPRYMVTKRYRQCMREWRALEKKYNVEVEPCV